MSELAKIDVSFDEIGRATVNLHNPNTGAVLVDNRGAKELGVVAGSSPKNAQSIVYTANDSTLNTIVGGKLGGLVAVRSTIIDPLVANLNSMVNTFVNRANSQHKAGINAAGAVGVSLFSVGSDGNHAENMTLAISGSDQISAAGRLKVAQGAANTAGIGVTLSYGQDSSWNNTIESNFSVTFTGATTYNITQSGSTTGYTGFNINNGITFGDVKIDFDKAPATSDSFAISSNAGGIGDNANIKMITGIRAEQIFSGKTLRNYYIDEVGKVANYSELTGMSSEAKQAVYDQAVRTKDQQSGVNLDEEAAELIRLQQAFQASAKMLQTARAIFDSIIAIR
jgi:flagellar hook-associated protein 1 FlgK